MLREVRKVMSDHTRCEYPTPHTPPCPLQLCLSLLCALQDNLRLSRLHHVPFNLQLATEEQFLSSHFAFYKSLEVLLAHTHGDVALGRVRWLLASAYLARVLEVDVPGLGGTGLVLKRKGEDAITLFNGILLRFVGCE